MEESIYRQRQTVQRLFGESATITGRMGSGVAPGNVQIHIGDKRLGCGRTFQQALQIASRKASGLAITTVAGVA